jgi:uncharacterized protein YnzC (UPF0291/DUF896 family)
MLDDEDIKRYNELREKDRNGTITESEYDEMFRLEQESIEEDGTRMMYLGM